MWLGLGAVVDLMLAVRLPGRDLIALRLKSSEKDGCFLCLGLGQAIHHARPTGNC